MKWMTMMTAAAMFATPLAVAQEQEREREQGEDEMTPAQAMELLEDAQRLMEKAEELLNDSSRGKALETESELKKKLERELKDQPEALQRRLVEKVDKLVEKAQTREKDAADKLDEVIKKARSASGKGMESRQPQRQKEEPSDKTRPQGPPPKQAYDPNRDDEPSKFKSRGDGGEWGKLPASVREAMRDASKEEVPPEFQELWKKYYESLEESGK